MKSLIVLFLFSVVGAACAPKGETMSRVGDDVTRSNGSANSGASDQAPGMDEKGALQTPTPSTPPVH